MTKHTATIQLSKVILPAGFDITFRKDAERPKMKDFLQSMSKLSAEKSLIIKCERIV